MDSQSVTIAMGWQGTLKLCGGGFQLVGWLVISREQSTVQIAVGRVGIQKRQRPATCNLTTAMCIETSTHRRKMCPAETAADDGPHGDHG